MKILSTILFLVFVNAANSAETRTYKKQNSSEAVVKIVTEEQDGTQAAVYVDAKENERFILDLIKDKNSKLFSLKQTIEKENCNTNSTPTQSHIDGCGEVTITKEVRTAFGRGGWASGGASYTFFVGFTSEGSGRFFDVSHMVTISEDVEAVTTSNGDYAGSVIKTLSLVRIVKLEDHTP